MFTFIYRATSVKRHRKNLFGIRVKLPPVCYPSNQSEVEASCQVPWKFYPRIQLWLVHTVLMMKSSRKAAYRLFKSFDLT